MAKTAVLVGCGAMSRGWLKAVADPALKDRVRIVGLVDLDENMARQRAAEFGLDGVAIGTDLDRVLGELHPDLLFDVVVPGARKGIVATGLKHGCHVLSEKPMATSMDDAREMIALAATADRTHAVVQNRRFNEGVRRIRATLESGVLGTPNAVHCDFFVGAHFGGFREEMDHVLLLDMAIHTFDAARFMTGETPQTVYCLETNPKSSWYAHGAEAYAIFEFSGDVVVTYRGSWDAEGANTSWDSDWRIVGSKGTLLWDGADAISANIVAGTDGFFRPLDAAPIASANPAQTQGHASVLLDFVDAIESGRQPETVSTDNIRSLAMVFAAIESADRGERVTIAGGP